MRILNATSDAGKIFKDDGTLRCPEWPKDAYLRCPTKEDQELYQFLEQSQWADGHIYASARWYERTEDDLDIGPEFVKDSFVFNGSGIHFHFLEGDSLTRDSLFFICEIPWKSIFNKTGSEFMFVGAERFRQAFLAHISKEQSSAELKLFWLQKDLTKISNRFEHLRLALRQ